MIKSYVYLLIAVGELRSRTFDRREDGFTTAELLGNAALGVVAIIAIWGALQAAGVNLVNDLMKKLTNPSN